MTEGRMVDDQKCRDKKIQVKIFSAQKSPVHIIG